MSGNRTAGDQPGACGARADLDTLSRFACLMLRAGNTADRTSAILHRLAAERGLDALSVSMSLESVVLSAQSGGGSFTAVREVGPPAVDASRIIALEHWAERLAAGASPGAIADELSQIERSHRLRSNATLASCIGAASGAFAALNEATAPAILAAAVGGGVGQYLRLRLAVRGANHFGSAALAAIVASGAYVMAAELIDAVGYGPAIYGAGFIASTLFLVPGVPLIGGLFDLLHYRTVVALGRLAYGTMILLSVALGLSIVIGLAQIDAIGQPDLQLPAAPALLLRALASFIAGAAFAMLFNGPRKVIVAAGLIALAANSLRLVLSDLGIMLAPATFLAALGIGIVGILLERRLGLPVIATTVAPTVIMMPGVPAFQTIVHFNHGQMLEGLQALASCGFLVGALAFGLAAASLLRAKAP